ncbi:MAG: hypothetical protein Kow0045_19360 [Albidovulum sp.]
MVQKGKFAACAAAVRVNALKSVDLPTFGSPTMPILKPIRNFPFPVAALVMRGAGRRKRGRGAGGAALTARCRKSVRIVTDRALRGSGGSLISGKGDLPTETP